MHVQAIYAAFGKGDIPGILERLSEPARWEQWTDNEAQKAGVSWLQPRIGKEGVAEFFKIVGGFTIKNFRVLSLMAGGDQVAAEVVIEAHVPGGGYYRDEELHLWTFDAAGKVVRMRHYVDT